MNLKKAIEILDLKIKGCNPYLSHDTDEACRLGIEAQKHLEELRIMEYVQGCVLLPGETED